MNSMTSFGPSGTGARADLVEAKVVRLHDALALAIAHMSASGRWTDEFLDRFRAVRDDATVREIVRRGQRDGDER